MKHNKLLQTEFAKIALDLKKRSIPKNEDVFTYKNIADNMWRDLWAAAKDHFNISFDWENNDSVGQRKVFSFTRKEEDGYEHIYKFNCELWIAGGDWEYPCYYFKCQIVDGSLYSDDDGPKLPFPGSIGTYLQSHFILIPPKDGGNSRLVEHETSKGKKILGAPSDGDVKSDDVPELEPRKAWDWIENYLKDLLDKYEKYWVERRKNQ
jgi:hypothetical protein